MDFIRRAWLFTKAKLSRTILLIVTFTAILVFVLSGLVINSAANASIANAEKAAGATVSLSVNFQNMIKKAQSSASSSSTSTTGGNHFAITMPTIAETTAQKIANLSGVKSYSFLLNNVSADADSGITKVSDTSTSTSNSDTQGQGRGGFGGGMPGGSQGDFSITGTNALSTDASFTGSYEITSGRAIDSSDAGTNNVVIESTLASQNNLKVGSTFTLKNTSDSTKTYKMTVVGIFTTKSSNSSEQSIQYMNTIYSALSLANTIKGTSGQISSATYNMSDPGNADSFVTEATKLVNNDEFQIAKDDSAYQTAKTTLGNVAGFAKNIVILVAIAGAIILGLIVMLMVRERRFEIGVLMSLGESRIKVIGQFFAELIMVMIVSVALASAGGNVVGNVVGQQLLSQETTQTSSTPSGFPGGNGGGQMQRPAGNGGGFVGRAGSAFGFGNSAQAKEIEKLNIKTSPTEILMLLGIAILIAALAVGLASIGILRLNPKQVLTN